MLNRISDLEFDKCIQTSYTGDDHQELCVEILSGHHDDPIINELITLAGKSFLRGIYAE